MAYGTVRFDQILTKKTFHVLDEDCFVVSVIENVETTHQGLTKTPIKSELQSLNQNPTLSSHTLFLKKLIVLKLSHVALYNSIFHPYNKQQVLIYSNGHFNFNIHTNLCLILK